MSEEKPGHSQDSAAPEHSSTAHNHSAPRKSSPRRLHPVLLAAGGAACLAAGFSLLSFVRTQNEDLSAPPRLPRRIRPAATPIPAPEALPTPSQAEAAAVQAALSQGDSRASTWAQENQAAVAQPALVVCEPLASASASQAFGDGCAPWLHLNASGEPNMGGTPLWHRVEYARLAIADSKHLRDEKRAAFRPGVADVALLYQTTGAARIAVGRLQAMSSAASAPAVLSYEVWGMPSKRRVATFSLRGTRASIAQQLPTLARSLHQAASTSGGEDEIPTRCELSAGEIEAVGRAPWSTWNVGSRGEKASASQVRDLEKLAPRSALAALEVLHTYPYTFGDARYDAAQAHLLRLAPRNALAWGGAWALSDIAQKPVGEQLESLSRRFPKSTPLHLAMLYRAQTNRNWSEASTQADTALRLSPRDPLCWRGVGYCAREQASELRQARYSGQISRAEWAKLNRWYQTSVLSHAHAASLDGLDGRTWDLLCEAATFDGNDNLALGALWHGLALDPENRNLCSWALHMLHPRWTNHIDLIPAIATHIERVRPLFDSLHGDAIQGLANVQDYDSSFKDKANAMLERTRVRLEDEARREPSNPRPHLALAYFAKRFGLQDTQLDNCVNQFRLYLALCPWDASAHYTLGWMLHHRKRQFAEARLEYQAALKIKPNYPEARFEMDNLPRQQSA